MEMGRRKHAASGRACPENWRHAGGRISQPFRVLSAEHRGRRGPLHPRRGTIRVAARCTTRSTPTSKRKALRKPSAPPRRIRCRVHISENDRSTPGTGRDFLESQHTTRCKRDDYNGWMVSKPSDFRLPALVAATKIWRRMFTTEEQLAADALKFMKSQVAVR